MWNMATKTLFIRGLGPQIPSRVLDPQQMFDMWPGVSEVQFYARQICRAGRQKCQMNIPPKKLPSSDMATNHKIFLPGFLWVWLIGMTSKVTIQARC